MAEPARPEKEQAALRRTLLAWYDRNRRDLPWRRTDDPYRIWVSEVMLQQTTVKTVLPYYEAFLKRFPTVVALAEEPEDEVLAAWSGLGYYHRARNLHRGAQHLAERHGGRFPRTLETALGVPEFDREGRLLIAHFGRLALASVYVPKGSGRDRDNRRVPYKLAFSRALFQRVEGLRRAGRRVLVMGDLNTAHREIDLARPRDNQKTSGFLPEERAEIDRWLAAGWIDCFRRFEKGPGHYSWWSQRSGARARNIGWRIDYVLASPAAMKFVRGAFITPQVKGSDHCPVGVEVDPGIFG